MQAFSDAVGRIYDAAVAPDVWPDALDAVRRLLGSDIAILSRFDVHDPGSWGWQHAIGFEPHYLDLYRTKYMLMNPWMDHVARLGSGEATYVSAHDDYSTLIREEFYQHWLKPQRLLDAAILMIDKAVGAVSTLIVSRTNTQGYFDAATLDVLTLLYPHVRRAAAIGDALRRVEASADTLAAVLDAIAAGLFLLDDAGYIVHANRAGRDMLASDDLVASVRGRLVAGRYGPSPLVGFGATIPASYPLAAGDGRMAMAHVIGLDPVRRDALAAERRATALVLIKEASPATTDAVATAVRHYRLTRQEARVLRMVVDAGGIPSAAEALNLSPTTVRTHVARLYDKTGVRSQAALVKLLGDMATPLRGG